MASVLVEIVRKRCQHHNMDIILCLLDCFETQNINKTDNAVLNWGNKHLHLCAHIFSTLFIFIRLRLIVEMRTKRSRWQSVDWARKRERERVSSGGKTCKYRTDKLHICQIHRTQSACKFRLLSKQRNTNGIQIKLKTLRGLINSKWDFVLQFASAFKHFAMNYLWRAIKAIRTDKSNLIFGICNQIGTKMRSRSVQDNSVQFTIYIRIHFPLNAFIWPCTF